MDESSDEEAPSPAELLAMISALRTQLSNSNIALAASNAATTAATTAATAAHAAAVANAAPPAPTIQQILAAIRPTTTVLVPVRGGVHPGTNLPYVGGGPIKLDYTMKLAPLQTTGYRGPGQFRTSKQMSLNSMAIANATTSATSLKFDGKNELTPTEATTQLSKADFLLAVNDHVLNFGLQPMFHMPVPDGTTTKMTYVVDHPHVLSVRAAKAEHLVRTEATARLGTIDEKPTDALTAYDSYEQDNCPFSGAVIFSLLSPRLRTQMSAVYGTPAAPLSGFPGLVSLAAALEICHSDSREDAIQAVASFKKTKLNQFPGLNVDGYSTEMMRLIKLMSVDQFTLNPQWGSMVLLNMGETGCKSFDYRLTALIVQVQDFEQPFTTGNFTQILEAPDYPTLGPAGLCTKISELFRHQKKLQDWPATAPRTPTPEANLGQVQPPPSGLGSIVPGANPDHRRQEGRGRGRGTDGRGPAGGRGGGRRPRDRIRGPTAANPCSSCNPPNHWKNNPACPNFVEREGWPTWRQMRTAPANITERWVFNGHNLIWCSKCNYGEGMFTDSHTTATHGVPRHQRPAADPAAPPVAPPADAAAVAAALAAAMAAQGGVAPPDEGVPANPAQQE